MRKLIGIHVQPRMPAGALGSRVGLFRAAGQLFEAKISERFLPNLTQGDSCAAAVDVARAVVEIQTEVAVWVPPNHSVVVSVTKFDIGYGKMADSDSA